MNEANKIKTDKAEDSKKKRKGLGFKRKLTCSVVVLFIVTICFSVFGILWYGGFIRQFTCDRVVAGSQIHTSFDCDLSSSNDDQSRSEYVTKQLEPRDDIVVSDLEEVITKVFNEASPAVVGIGIKGNDFGADQVIGTGFLVTENGLIVTNRHVVESTKEDYFVNLKDSEESISVTEIFRDPVNDLALIRIEKDELSSLPLGDSDNLMQGQTVIAIGNPLGKYSGTVTSGIISGLNREVDISEGFFSSAFETYEDVIQTDAAINPGNSGGPLLNSNGEVIGINFATVSGADNLSFAIPINRIKSRISELNEHGRFRIPFVGVEYRMRIVFLDNTSTIGAEVSRVLKGESADKAGLKRGDIIVEFNGSDLEDESLFSLIQKTEIGDEVDLVILRAGKTFNATLKIGERGSDF
ncbi:MAG: S1C family serine protease [Candidatus Dojkabacteria bacterium]